MPSAAPKGYKITDNALHRQMATLMEMYRLIGSGKFISLLVIGPPGLGKTVGAESMAGVGDNRIVKPRAAAMQMMDLLHRHRAHTFILVWDDYDSIYTSEPLMNIFKQVVDPRHERRISDDRKNGHGVFRVYSRHVFITNKNLNDPKLEQFDKNMRPHIESLLSKFQLKVVLTTSDARRDRYDAYHYSCWVGTDGYSALRKLSYESPRGRITLSLAAQNEVLAWFANNFNRLNEVSPRSLMAVADYRLKVPEAWESLAEQWCAIDVISMPKTNSKGEKKDAELANPPMWQLEAPAKAVPPAAEPEPVKVEAAPMPPPKKKPAAKAAPKKAAPKKAKAAPKKKAS